MTDITENTKEIAYCGLYCGDCFGYKQKIADLARDLRKELRQSKFAKTAASLSEVSFFKAYQNYPQCYEVLGAMVKLRCKSCKDGGGPPFCKMRKCCQKKGFEGCWQCDDFETCDKLDFLKANHDDAHLKNLRILSKKGVDAFLSGKKYW
jgi:hypothetical protein